MGVGSNDALIVSERTVTVEARSLERFRPGRLSHRFQQARPADLLKRRAAGQSQRQIDVGDQVGEHVAHALFTCDGQAEGVGPAKQNGTRSQRDRLEHVRPAPDAAVKENGRPIADGVDDTRQGVKCRQGPIELAAAVVGDDHAGHPMVDGPPRVVGVEHALHQHRQPGRLAQPPQIVPSARGSEKTWPK